MLLHRVGQRRAAFDVGARLQNDGREVLVLFLRAEDLEALHERQAGVDHHRELPREDREVLGRRRLGAYLLRAAAALTCAGVMRVTRICSRRSADDDRVHRVAGALAVDRSRRRASVRRMQTSA